MELAQLLRKSWELYNAYLAPEFGTSEMELTWHVTLHRLSQLEFCYFQLLLLLAAAAAAAAAAAVLSRLLFGCLALVP